MKNGVLVIVYIYIYEYALHDGAGCSSQIVSSSFFFFSLSFLPCRKIKVSYLVLYYPFTYNQDTTLTRSKAMHTRPIRSFVLVLLNAVILCALNSRLAWQSYTRGAVALSRLYGSPPVSPEIEDQFKEWEVEERENMLEELRGQAREDPDRDVSDGELPDYMLRMIEEFEEREVVVVQEEEQAEKLPSIAVIGRPNTGKSTIVNRLTETYKDGAIVHDEPGITRDRTYRAATHNGYNFQVIDTGGIVFDDTEDIFASKITEQALQGLREASCALLICDGQSGVTPLDRALAEWLRRNSKVPLYLCVNKCESETRGQYKSEITLFYSMTKTYFCSHRLLDVK